MLLHYCSQNTKIIFIERLHQMEKENMTFIKLLSVSETDIVRLLVYYNILLAPVKLL